MQKAILVGTLLGDGFLQKTGVRNARLRLEHGHAQKEYLLWKATHFPKLFQGKATYLERVHPISKKIYKYWRQQSSTTPELGRWRTLFYPDGKKHIPETLSEILTDPLSLAVWYMDDGYFDARSKNSYFYLGRVTEHEAEIAKAAIKKNFGISGTVYDKKKKGYTLFFPVQATVALRDCIHSFVLPLFDYKFAE
ncbi:MAG: homing endonuclease [Parcubacteria group bacterium Greene0416_14]|nr:MAG: homing endonuclease [Parcubacteria group bacterium Greene0416_14]